MPEKITKRVEKLLPRSSRKCGGWRGEQTTVFLKLYQDICIALIKNKIKTKLGCNEPEIGL